MIQTKDKFNWRYFGLGNEYGGYRQYHDHVRNWIIYDRIMKLKPTSVLELGCARGYLLNRFKAPITAIGYDVSRHAYLTRIVPGVQLRDISETPWPLESNSIDVCYSVETLDMIPEDKLPAVMKEIRRVSRRGIHFIEFGRDVKVNPLLIQGIVTKKSQAWWDTWMGENQAVVPSKEINEGMSRLEYNTGPIKINAGSGTEMFYYGWRNVDMVDLTGFAIVNSLIFIPADLLRASLYPVGSQTTAILSSHLIDRFTPKDAKKFLSICWDTLQPGGTLRIAVPDKAKLEDMADRSQLGFFDDVGEACSKAKTQADKLHCLLHEGHNSVYDEPSLRSILHETGFSRIDKRAFRESGSKHIREETYDTLPDLSLYMEARKLVY